MVSKRRSKAKAVPQKTPVTTPVVNGAIPPATALVPASLPPQVPTTTPSVSPKKRDTTILPSRSLVRQKVLAIISLRLQGKTNDEIADTLHLKPQSVRQYMFLAGRNGWLKKKAVDPTDRLEFEIAHKVVRNLDEMLDSDDESRRDLATMKTADGMLFKKFAEAPSAAPPLAVIGVRIEMPAGVANMEIREGTTGGAPRFTEGEVVNGEKAS